ncbi:MAG: serine/threonine protein kinase [Cyanobacteria bacterium SZAS-4]|nr:serine/threonine protein kinase [Cyanobacteria bacterium SZAS-4]
MSAEVKRLNEKVCLECNRQFTGIVAACPHDGTLLVNVVQDPLLGTTLAGNYEIQEVIGHGGMGVVYKARHALMDRIVAIKMLQAQLISDSMSVKRFQQESQSASRISHPNVITVYDFGISPSGQPFIVMDYLQGISLADVIKDEGQIGVERSIKILAQACDALDHAHKMGVLHRDVKPTNFVLINYDEEKDFVKVVDFGVAKLMNATPDGQRLTQAGEVCGSPVYMSPEQCTGAELDQRSDIYSMGIVVYETLTGKLPILGKTMVDTMSKHISEMPPTFQQARPDLYIPERLEQVVFKALAKDPNDRHQSMDELRIDLENAIPRPGKSQVLRSAPSDQRSPGELLAAVLQGISMKVWAGVLAVVVVGGLAALQLRKMSTVQQPPAQHETAPPSSATTTKVAPPVTPTATDTSAGTTTPTTTPTTTQTPAPADTAPETAVKPVTTKHQNKHLNPVKTDDTDSTSETASSTPGRRHAYSSAPSYVDMMQTAAADKPKKHKKVRTIAASTSAPATTSSSEARWNSLKTIRSYTP